MNQYSKRYNYYDRFTRFICFIKVDESCNLNCKFCYQKNKTNRRLDTEKQFDECFKNLDYVIKRFQSLKNGFYDHSTLKICFFGGEPTLNLKAINKICDFLKQNYTTKERKNINLTMTSNGVIFNDAVKRTLINMRSVNPSMDVNVMISTDNDKEAYDENRKLVGSNKSAYELVQNNIKEYNIFLKELNGKSYNKEVVLSTVLASVEQIKKTPELIQKRYKEITRSGKLIYDVQSMGDEYISEAQKFLLKMGRKLINDLTLENKEDGINTIMEAFWGLNGDYSFEECNSICTIDGSGKMNWCNKIVNFEDQLLDQDELRKLSVFNRDADNSHFRCVKEKHKNGNLVKRVVRKKLWEETKLAFDPTVPIQYLKISDNIKWSEKLKDFVLYMLCSTNMKTKGIIAKNIPDDVKDILVDSGVEINPSQLKGNISSFFIDESGDVFFNEVFKSNKNLVLTNIYQKHFMWIYTPNLIESVNRFFRSKLNN